MGNSGFRKMFWEGDLVESPFRSVHDISVISLDKTEITLGNLTSGRMSIIVNTGSQNATFSAQVNELNELRQRNANKLEVIAFPCNQFHNEPSDFKTVAGKYLQAQAAFPVLQKIEVNGPHMHPLYKFLKRHSILYNFTLLNGEKITEDFCKFLCNSRGEVVRYYPASISLAQIQQDIDAISITN